ncbi:heterotrimeric G protein alpha subunit B [Flagelloscypha sp. PMI_526]|nr:heterotrimeric G protein alpha subunit B [Flagelloscypha sp. PMI_526]
MRTHTHAKTAVPKYDPKAAAVNADIEAYLKEERALSKNILHFLVLGTPGSGKSSILRNFGTPRQNIVEYTMAERDSYRENIFSYLVKAMLVILEEVDALDLMLRAANEEFASVILDLDPKGTFSGADMPLHISRAFANVYSDPAVKTVLSRSKKLDRISQGLYFLEEFERIASPHYLPSDLDIQHCCELTGITNCQFGVGELTYVVWDVNGQRGQRRKWVNCFEKITAIFFIVSMSSYDELDPGGTQTGIEQSLSLLDDVSNCTWFQDTAVLLIFNKIDLFAEKLPHNPLSEYYPDFTGGSNFDEACDFVVNRFVSLNKNPDREFYTCFTHAGGNKPDLGLTKFILNTAQHIILQAYLRTQKLL